MRLFQPAQRETACSLCAQSCNKRPQAHTSAHKRTIFDHGKKHSGRSWLASRARTKRIEIKTKQVASALFSPACVRSILRCGCVLVKLCLRAILSFSELLWFYYGSQVINATLLLRIARRIALGCRLLSWAFSLFFLCIFVRLACTGGIRRALAKHRTRTQAGEAVLPHFILHVIMPSYHFMDNNVYIFVNQFVCPFMRAIDCECVCVRQSHTVIAKSFGHFIQNSATRQLHGRATVS